MSPVIPPPCIDHGQRFPCIVDIRSYDHTKFGTQFLGSVKPDYLPYIRTTWQDDSPNVYIVPDCFNIVYRILNQIVLYSQFSKTKHFWRTNTKSMRRLENRRKKSRISIYFTMRLSTSSITLRVLSNKSFCFTFDQILNSYWQEIITLSFELVYLPLQRVHIVRWVCVVFRQKFCVIEEEMSVNIDFDNWFQELVHRVITRYNNEDVMSLPKKHTALGHPGVSADIGAGVYLVHYRRIASLESTDSRLLSTCMGYVRLISTECSAVKACIFGKEWTHTF